MHAAVAVAVGALALIATAPRALAHGTASSATPEPGSNVDAVEEIRLGFDDPLLEDGQFLVRLQTDDGTRMPIGEPQLVDPRTLSASVTRPLEDGDYVVVYSVTFADGGETEDAYTFTVGGSGWLRWWPLAVVGAIALLAAGAMTVSRGRSSR